MPPSRFTTPRTLAEQLVYATAWLHPEFLAPHLGENYEVYDESPSLEFAATALSWFAAWTDMYQQLTSAISKGRTPEAIHRYVIGATIKAYPAIPWPEEGYWDSRIPVNFYAVEWDQPNYATRLTPLMCPLVEIDGKIPEAIGYKTVWAYQKMAINFLHLLRDHPSSFLADLSIMIRWFFGLIDNDLFQMTMTDAYSGGYDPSPFSTEALEFFNELHTEAEALCDQAFRAIQKLERIPELFATYHDLATRLHHLTRQGEDPAYDTDCQTLRERLAWLATKQLPCPSHQPDPDPVTPLLPIRSDPAGDLS